MKSSKIKSFSVHGLFGTSDIHITFEDDVKILIGENGLGKTQVLNLFYYTLTRDFLKLNDYKFEKLVLVFFDGKPLEISKKNVEELVEETYRHPLAKELIEDIGFTQFQMLYETFMYGSKNDWDMIERKLMRLDSKFGNYSPNKLSRMFEEVEVSKSKASNAILDKCKEEIAKAIGDLSILYFHVFRLVEEDFQNIDYVEDNNHSIDNDTNSFSKNTIIDFGMNDVQRAFNKTQNKIETLLKEGLSVFLKDVLKIVMSKNTSLDTNIFDRINEKDLAIIFSRAKDLDNEIKEAVLESVRKKEFNGPLSGLILQKLVELYENQKELDSAVILFRDVCNKYLINKKVFYDESAIKIFIKSDLTSDAISLKHLSSGEKQIISIFSKIYLSETDKKFMVLFDEPELSLSMFWQRNLLPDIYNSGKCDFLFAVTHSPFIFENELDKYTVGLGGYIKPLKPALV